MRRLPASNLTQVLGWSVQDLVKKERGGKWVPRFQSVIHLFSDYKNHGTARRRGAGSTASVGEPDVDVGVAEAGVSGPLRANIVKAPRFSVRAAAARQYWQVIIILET